MHIGKILSNQASTLQTNEQIDKVVVVFYGEQFHAEMLKMDYVKNYLIQKSISDDKNETMSRLLD